MKQSLNFRIITGRLNGIENQEAHDGRPTAFLLQPFRALTQKPNSKNGFAGRTVEIGSMPYIPYAACRFAGNANASHTFHRGILT
ncbi:MULTISPECIES: hypothetical protein [unclassified Neisseria]|uniref:hypothetical protein n=1 Tax=unclassified Neisseria TaxID=2623750 RepID=UPI00107287B4|nr:MULTISPECIES: hypothetical protein [unclassified Neisseria]MBF0803258.1 hypothetical protein [Neisseria sp. 19428wB4_WF04]TFU44097.1 hypothetical protein E4T99_02620 [Neisseria sp. WF04]